jgi:hypothetical protein
LFLPALKYYNPSVQIHVDNPTDIKAGCRIALTFEHSNPQQLMQLQKNRMWNDPPNSPSSADSSQYAERSSADVSPEPVERKWLSKNIARVFTPGENGLECTASRSKSYNPEGLMQFNGQVIRKPQAAGSTTASTPAMYTRTIGRRTDHRDVMEIWAWVRNLTSQRTAKRGDRVQLSPEERKLKDELVERMKKAQADRVREEAVKAAKRAEEAELEKAKRAMQEAEVSAV